MDTHLADNHPDLAGAEPGNPLSRRAVLRIVAASGAGVALIAACGGDDDTTAGTGSTDSATAGEDTPSADDATESEDAGGGGGGLVAVADVPVGGGVILEEQKVVVTQPAEGEFKAFTAICTHQSCTVASVKGDTINCACHGSAYSASDGSVINGPATRPLEEIAVTVEGDQIVQS